MRNLGVLGAIVRQDFVAKLAVGVGEPLERALEAGGVGTWSWDRSSGVVVWNAVMAELFGVDRDGFGGSFDAWVELVHPDDRARSVETVMEAVSDGGSYSVEHRVILADGTVRWVRGQGHIIQDDSGDIVGTTGCAWDVTEQITIAEEREQAISELELAAERDRVARERLEFLTRVTDVLATAESQQDIMRGAAFAAVPRLGDWCALAVLPDDGSLIPDIEVAHADPEMVAYARELQERFPYDPDAASGIPQVIRTGDVEFIPMIDDEVLDRMDTTDEAREEVRRLQLRSLIIVPLRKRRRVLGAIQFVNSSLHRSYNEDDVLLARAVASRIASSLENRRLTERLHRDEFRAALDAMLDNVAIGQAVRNDDGEIVDFVIQFMNAASSDGANRGPNQLVGKRLLDAYPGLADSGLFERYVRVVESREPLITDRMRYDDVTADGEVISGWWSLRVVPFGDGYLASSRDETATVTAELELQEAREAKARTRIALEVLQAAALPRELPVVEGLDFGVRYEPAAPGLPVGGDWYDIFEIPNRNAVGLVVADVAGHGSEPAALMVQVRNSLRAYAMEGHDPGDVLRHLNRTLRFGNGSQTFVTCTYVMLELGSLQARWACAGHFPPLLARSGCAELLGSEVGPPLGVDEGASYENSTADLRPADEMLLFTDGLIERRSELIDQGIDRLARVLRSAPGGSAQTFVDHVIDELISDGQRGDDIAVVGARITDRDPSAGRRR